MRFCGQCGATLSAACPSCGAANPSENRFCGQCGAILGGPGFRELAAAEAYSPRSTSAATQQRSGTGEIKQVTVLLCDIVNSTALTERLGPEAMRDLVAAFLEASLAEVERYGGTTPQFTGDGFLALFGAPVSQEDHVRRALLAAVAIQRAVSSDDGMHANRLNLRVRIGVHSGPVVFGEIGDGLPFDRTVIGDTANVAARLQQLAEPGTVLISEATCLMAQGYVRAEPVAPLAAKGKAEPISAYRLLGISHRRSAIDEAASAHKTLFVGRDDELAILNDRLRQVVSGQGQAIGIVGEPGIGKSRLLAEFHRQLAADSVTWVEGRCLSYGASIPYWLVIDLLRSNCGIVETDTPDAITDKVRSGLGEVGIDPDQDGPVLLRLLGIDDGAGGPLLSNPEAVKAKAFEVFRRLSILGNKRRPLILVLEDLHWVDDISEEFLGLLAEDVADAPLFLLAAYRPGYRPPWLNRSYAGQVPLHPLTREDSLRVVRSVVRAEPVVDQVTEEIVTKADGNPLFLEQLALHAGEAKSLRSLLMVPNTIHDVVMARTDRLPERTKQLLQTAAVIGREVPLRLLRGVSDDSGSLATQLRELCRLEFVYERIEPEGAVYIFRHALTQEAVYGSLLERQRRRHHGAVGRALEELYQDRGDEVAELLALHFGRSDESEKAVDYAILAAEKAQRRWANREALSYFNDTLRRLDAMPDTEANRLRRVDAIIKQAEVKFALGQHLEHIQALDQIRGVVEGIEDPQRRAAWHYWRGFLHSLTGGRPDVAIDHCNEAVALAAAAGLDETKAFADSCLAQVYLTAGRLREAIEAGERAVAIFETRNNPWWASRTLWHLAQSAIYLGAWSDSLSYCRRALAHAETVDDLRLRVVALYRTGSAYILQGDVERGLRYCDEALALQPIPYDLAMARVFRGYGHIRAGRFDSGIADLSQAIAWLAASGLSHVRLAPTLRLAEGYLGRGEIIVARGFIADVLSQSRAAGFRYLEGLANRLMAECLVSQSAARAEQHARDAEEIFEALGAQNDFAKTIVTRARLSQSSGNYAEARRLLEKATVIFRGLGTIDEPDRVRAALAALDRGSLIRPLGAVL
jgi:class 3 adenylate cyclase/tetratricopeptide (TPR) repeat protein